MSASDLVLIDKCVALGLLFLSHFGKCLEDIKNSDDERLHHHLFEMQGFWDQVKNLKRKATEKTVSNTKLIDWFFTAGQIETDFFKDSISVNLYKKFYRELLKNRNAPIKHVFTKTIKSRVKKNY